MRRTVPSVACANPAPRPTARYLGSISRRTRFPHRAGAATGSWCAAAASWWPSIWRGRRYAQLPLEEGRATNDFLASTHVGTRARVLIATWTTPPIGGEQQKHCLVRIWEPAE